MLDLRRRKIGITDYVNLLEQSIIDYLEQCGVSAARRSGAPGVYVEGRKIAALGVRVRRGCSYHGLALNVNMDINPFNGINACGYPQLEVVQLADYYPSPELDKVTDGLLQQLFRNIIVEPYDLVTKQGLADLITGDAVA